MWESVTSKLFGNFFMNFNNAIERNMVYALRLAFWKCNMHQTYFCIC